MAAFDAEIRFDYHTHSTYSDGADPAEMVAAAAASGLDGVGFADHCNVTDPRLSEHDVYSLHETYDERRAVIADLRERFDVAVFDAVELDYTPGEEERLAAFLDSAGFDYSLGSVHHVDGYNVLRGRDVADEDDERLSRLVDDYFDAVVALVESELFDVVSHLDVVTRNPYLCDRPERAHYERVAAALADSRTTPEINLRGAPDADPVVHPDPAYLDAFTDRGVEFVVGTDAHRPEQITDRLRALADRFEWATTAAVDGLAPFAAGARPYAD